MADHPHAARYRKLMEEFNAGNFEGMDDALADDVTWHQIGDRTIEGKAALIATMQETMGEVEISAALHDVVANDDHLIALVEATATRGGDTFEYRTAEIHHVDSEGRVTERWAFSDDTQAIVDFFA